MDADISFRGYVHCSLRPKRAQQSIERQEFSAANATSETQDCGEKGNIVVSSAIVIMMILH